MRSEEGNLILAGDQRNDKELKRNHRNGFSKCEILYFFSYQIIFWYSFFSIKDEIAKETLKIESEKIRQKDYKKKIMTEANLFKTVSYRSATTFMRYQITLK